MNNLRDRKGDKLLFAYHYLTNNEFKVKYDAFKKSRVKGKKIVLKTKDINIQKCIDVYHDLKQRLQDPNERFSAVELLIAKHEAQVDKDRKCFIYYKRKLYERRKENEQVLDVFSTLKQPFYFPGPSPHPFLVATGLYLFISNLIHWLWFSASHGWGALAGFLLMLYAIVYWFRDLIIESSFKSAHTTYDNRKFKHGFFLFLVSEVMFFWSFFWAFFHSSLAPGIGIYFMWPPIYIEPIKWYMLPLTNTFVLVGSGFHAAALTGFLKTRLPLPKLASYTWYCLLGRDMKIPVIAKKLIPSIFYLKLILIRRIQNDIGHKLYGISIFAWTGAIWYGTYFIFLQFYEFYCAPFCINSGIYGSCFFLITGLHGLHVIVGWIFLLVQRARFLRNHFKVENYLGIRMAIWYWHFVDVIWILVMFWVYWWGS